MLIFHDTIILCGFSMVVIYFFWLWWCSRRKATKPRNLAGSAEPHPVPGVHFIEPRKLLGIHANAQLTQEHLHQMHHNIIASSSTRPPMHTQGLVSAVVMLAMESKLCKADVDCARLTQDVQEMRNLVGVMEQRGQLAEASSCALKNALQKLESKLSSMQEVARCAPPYAQSVLCFLHLHCTQRPDLSVSTAKLYGAYLAFFQAHSSGKPPQQKDFRALLEHLGFVYDQLYLNGANARGFRGLSLA